MKDKTESSMLRRVVQKECVPVVLLCALMLSLTWGARWVGVQEARHEELVSSRAAADVNSTHGTEPIPTRTPNPGVMLVAHRGAKFYAPENTIPAIEKAIELGYDYVEFDVRFTSDGVPVILHDETVDRTTDGHGAIAEMTLADVKKLDAGSSYSKKFTGTRIPTFEECLQAMQGRIRIYLDTKVEPRQVLIDLLKKYDFYPDRVILVAQTAGWRALDPAAPVMPGVKNAETVDAVIAQFPSPKAFNTNCQTLTADTVRAAHDRGVMIFANVLNVGFPSEEKQCMKNAIDMGADAIQTDRPDIALPLVQKLRDKFAVK